MEAGRRTDGQRDEKRQAQPKKWALRDTHSERWW